MSLAIAVLAVLAVAPRAEHQGLVGPDTVVVTSGSLRLRALLWRPQGKGPFPAVLFSHGSAPDSANSANGRRDARNRERGAAALGPIFARHGYVFLYLFRRGAGLSAGQGTYSGDLRAAELAANGPEAHDRLQIRLLEGDELSDAFAGLAYLRSLQEVDAGRIAAVGHSFGGSLTLLMAERDSTLRAAIDFASAAGSWRSAPLRERLRTAVSRTTVPTFFIHASNDYSIEPGKSLAADMTRLGKPHRLRIYPAFGPTSEEGHSIVYLSTATWEADVFAFLETYMRPQSRGPRFERTACWVDGDWARDVQRECGWLVVPESRDRPSTHNVRLAVEIFRARDPTGAPPLVFLHGGPGGPGGIRLYSEGIARSRSSLHRDVVVYDQRGAGLSLPKLCAAYDTAPDAAAGEARRACIAELEAQGIDRYAYNTGESVADLIDLRRALGYESWDVYGVSYGARVVQETMARDGRAIHSVVLASPVARSFSFQAEQPLSTQRALEHVFAACAHQPSCRDAFPNVEEDFYQVYEYLTSSPVPVPIMRPDSTPDTVRFDGRRLIIGIRNRLLYRPRAAVARFPFLLHELRVGDRARAAREILGEGSANVPDAALHVLINCSDHATFGTVYRKTVDSVNALARPPFRRVSEQGCEEWLPQLRDEAMPPPVRSDIPTLILTGSFDDRTPREHASRIAATLSRAYLVEFPDEGHDTRPGACHAAIVQQFLDDPSRQPDTSCMATIPPIPFATTWEAR